MTVVADPLAARYEDEGVVEAIPILSAVEVRRYREIVERTCAAIGGRITRLDGIHRFFGWAWELGTHPRLLRAIESLIGPGARLTSARIFYKHPHSESYVGWHQDGITESLEDARVPAVWLGLTDATVANGCLRVVPRSHRLGLLRHADVPHPHNLTSAGRTAEAVSGDALFEPRDVLLRAGEMSVHHPLIVHGSNANRSSEPRIGFSATYSATSFGGDAAPPPPSMPFEEAVVAYLASGEQILFDAGGEA